MNITLVCGHYLPALGYLEVHLARALAALGHKVAVVTSAAVPPYVAHLHAPLREGLEQDGAVSVHRLKPRYSIGQVVVANGVRETVKDTRPELVIAIGLGKAFPLSIYPFPAIVISLFGDNHHSYAAGSFAEKLKVKAMFRLLKAPTYRAAVEHSDVLVAYTPESFAAAAKMLGGRFAQRLREQKAFISLGFDPAHFYFDPALRQKMRSEHGLADVHRVLITSTRVVPEKALEEALPAIAALPEHWQWWVIGADEGSYAKAFEKRALAALGPRRFRLLPYQERLKLNAYFNAADASLYTVPAISVFEVLGSGLPCLLPNKASLAHVLQQEALARVATRELKDDLSHFNLCEEARKQRATLACEHYSWRAVAQKLLDEARTLLAGSQ